MTSGNGKASAERKQNYDIDGSAPSGINVTDAVLEADQQTVVLTLNKALIAGNTYTLEVKDVESSDGVPIVPDPSTFTFVAGEGNGLTASYWNFDVFGSGNAFPSGPATHVRQDAPVCLRCAGMALSKRRAPAITRSGPNPTTACACG
jgi:hypothetical protein